MNGDTLARGAKSATFGPAKVSQAKWDSIFGTPEEQKKEETQKFEEQLRETNVQQS